MFGLLGLIKGVAVVCSMAFALPIGGVYASADSPSKYLDRLTTVNTSMNRESNDASPGVEDEPTVSHAVKTSHGVILNTVVRNANRLEYVDDVPVITGADRVEPVRETVTRSAVIANDGNDHTVNPVNTDVSVDGQAQGIEWPEGGFTGSSTVTYDANGKGQFTNGSTTNQVTTRYDGFKDVTKYAHTDNVNDAGDVQNENGYGDNKSYSRVVTIPGASSLTVNLTYHTEGTNWDWVCAYTGGTESSPAGDAQCSTAGSLTGKLGGTTKTTRSFTVDGDSVTFWFKSDSSGSNYYGYYAVVKGLVGSKETVSGTYAKPVDPSGEYEFASWNTKADGTGKNLGTGEVYFPSNQTVYAQWKLSYTKWNTVGWRITDDGTLKLRPWEGDTGTTGTVTYYTLVPWYSQSSKIKKVESIGTIVLNANSVGLFYNCSNLTDITGLASWDVSNVTSMDYMFYECSSLTDLTGLKDWNMSKVTSMSWMFNGCSNLTDLTGLKDWNVAEVRDMDRMFWSCSSLTDISGLENWNVSNVTDMSYMFSGCSSLTDLTPLANWTVSNVKSMSYMFSGCSKLTNLTALTNWTVSNVTSMDYMFANCSSLTDLTGLKDWDVSNVTRIYSMFSYCSSLTVLTGLSGWNVSNLTNMNIMFYRCSNLTDLTALKGWNVSNVTSMGSMFSDCSSLTDLTPLAHWNVSNVTSMYNMFKSCSSLTDLTPLERWNVSNVTSMNYMFQNCSSLTDLTGLKDWTVSKVTDMDGMFHSCSSLTALTGLANWTVSNVTDMRFMFYHCSSLTNLTGLERWNVSNVTNMSGMFYYCSSLTDLTPLADWNVSNVENMSYMFRNCYKLIALTGLSGWKVSNVTNMNSMFSGCSKLTDLTALASWNVSKVTDMSDMFFNCYKIQKVGIPSIANGGQKLVANASTNGLSGSLVGSRIITEDLQLGPYTWDELNTEMTTNPEGFTEGHVWVRYTPSWIVTYHANGAIGSMPGSMVSVSSPLTLPKASFLRFGYKFIGWTTQPGPVSSVNPLLKPGETYKPVNVIEGQEYHLYAQWEKIGEGEDQPVTGQSGSLPGWVQVGSENTRNDIIPNQSQSVVFTNKYDPGLTSIQFRFTKLMDGNVPDDSEHFQFELFSMSENKVIQTTVNNGASVQFKPITYDKAGTYKYYVRETPSNASNGANSNPNLDYDDHLVEVVVTVTEENDPTSPSGKKLTATAQITGDTVFRNDSKPASLDITKIVMGVTDGMSETHKDREFTFNVALLDRDNQPVSGKTYPTTITNNSESSESNGDASSSTGSITFDNSGNATVKLKAGSKFTINGIPVRVGSTFTINGIPAYYKYTVTETNIPAGYENMILTNSSGVLGANSHVTVEALNRYTVTPASASLQVGKILLAPGGLNQSVNNGEFRFALCQVTPAPIGPESGPNVESCAGVSEASNDGNGLVTFPQLTYDTIGTYTYQIREVKGNALDMKYDSTVYTVTVNVTDDGEGRLVAKVTYRNDTTGVESSPGSSSVWDPSDPGSMGVPVFVNRTTVANRLPVTGGRDVIIASVILALILAGGLFVFLRRNREE